VATIQKFELKITTRDHSNEGEADEYDKAFTK
jgi:hypothetical protein